MGLIERITESLPTAVFRGAHREFLREFTRELAAMDGEAARASPMPTACTKCGKLIG